MVKTSSHYRGFYTTSQSCKLLRDLMHLTMLGEGLLSVHIWSSLKCLLPKPKTSPKGREFLKVHAKPGFPEVQLLRQPIPEHPPPQEILSLGDNCVVRIISGTFLGFQFPFFLSSLVNPIFGTPRTIVHLLSPLLGPSSMAGLFSQKNMKHPRRRIAFFAS